MKIKKAYLSILLSLTMALSMLGIGSLNITFAAESIKIQILGTSDVHGRFDTYNYANNTVNTDGSLTQIAAQVKQLRQENPNTILVDAGDSIQDNMSNIFLDDEKHPMIAAMDAMEYDTWTLGNHEFNYGTEVIERIIQQPEMDVLCGNVYKKDGTRLAKPYAIKEVAGVKVAIIGMTTPNIMRWDGEKLEGYTVTSPIDETRKAILEIKQNKAADIFIAVVHMGFDEEYRSDDSAESLAKAFPDLSAIICGHAHETISGRKVGNTVICEPGKYGERLSQINLTLMPKNEGGYEVIEATGGNIAIKNGDIDRELDEMLKPYHDKAIEYGNEIIGEVSGGSLVPPDEIPGITQAQIQDTALMHLYHDTMSYYSKQFVPEDAKLITSVALLDKNSNLEEGSIKRSDLVKIYKFENAMHTLKIDGKQLKKYMEWSASYFNQYKDGDLTISFNPDMPVYLYDTFGGVTYDINISKPVGNRIYNLKYIDGTEVKDEDIIYLTTSDYRATSKLLNDLFKDENVEIVHKTDDDAVATVRDLIAMYIQDVKGGVITNEFTSNWKITGTKFDKVDPSIMEQLKQMVADGKLSISSSDTGKNSNTKSITMDDFNNAVK